MQSGFFTRVCGDLIIHPDLQMANWASTDHVLYEDEYKWREHFYKLLLSDRKDIPLPIVYNNKMYFCGGLKPIGIKINTNKEDCIFGLENGIPTYKVVPLVSLRQPNDAEYNKYFKPILESGVIRLNTNDIEDSCYITLKGLSFFSFDTKIVLDKLIIGRTKKERKWRKIKISDEQYKEVFMNYKRKGEKNDQ